MSDLDERLLAIIKDALREILRDPDIQADLARAFCQLPIGDVVEEIEREKAKSRGEIPPVVYSPKNFAEIIYDHFSPRVWPISSSISPSVLATDIFGTTFELNNQE